jgi:hypothetical protein
MLHLQTLFAPVKPLGRTLKKDRVYIRALSAAA